MLLNMAIYFIYSLAHDICPTYLFNLYVSSNVCVRDYTHILTLKWKVL